MFGQGIANLSIRLFNVPQRIQYATSLWYGAPSFLFREQPGPVTCHKHPARERLQECAVHACWSQRPHPGGGR